MPKQPGRQVHKPKPVDLSQYLIDQWLMPNTDGGLCAAGCGRTIVGMSRCSTIVPESTVQHLYGHPDKPDAGAGYGEKHCDSCRHQLVEHLNRLLATYLSPVCAHCTLVIETGHPCCLVDLPLGPRSFVQSIYGEDACSQPPGHAGPHRNKRGDTWAEDGTPV